MRLNNLNSLGQDTDIYDSGQTAFVRRGPSQLNNPMGDESISQINQLPDHESSLPDQQNSRKPSQLSTLSKKNSFLMTSAADQQQRLATNSRTLLFNSLGGNADTNPERLLSYR